MVSSQGLSGKFSNNFELVEIRDIFPNNDIVLLTGRWDSDHTTFMVTDFTYFWAKQDRH